MMSTTVPLSETIRFLEETVGRKLRLRRLPRADGDPGRTAADLSRAREELGYRPASSWKEALRRQADWFRGPRGPLAAGAQEWP